MHIIVFQVTVTLKGESEQAANNPVHANDDVAAFASEKLLDLQRLQDDDRFGDCQPTQAVHRVEAKPPHGKDMYLRKETNHVSNSRRCPGAQGGADGHEGTPGSEVGHRQREHE